MWRVRKDDGRRIDVAGGSGMVKGGLCERYLRAITFHGTEGLETRFSLWLLCYTEEKDISNIVWFLQRVWQASLHDNISKLSILRV